MKKIVLLIFVALTAFLTSSFSSAQIEKTILQVRVLDDMGDYMKGAEVRLFETKENYDKLENPIGSGVTNKKGKVLLKSIPTGKSFFIYVKKGDKTNAGLGVETGVLKAKVLNKINIVISDQ